MSVRAAIIGLGDISSLHLAAIDALDDVELVAVCDIDPDRAAAASERLGVPAYASHQALFAGAQPDVVHITTPHSEHAAAAIDALDAGIHVIVEKPVARDPRQAAAVEAAAARSSAKIAVCFQNRYNTPVRAAKQLLDSGALGAITGAAATVIWHRTAAYYEAAPWRGTWAGGGGGLLMNQAIHTLDLLRWLVGPVVSVTGTASTRVLPIEVEDTAELTLTHDGGIRSGFYATNTHATNAPITVDIVAENGQLSLRENLVVSYADGRTETVADDSVATGERAYWGVSHERLITDFYARLGEVDPFWITPADGARVVDIIHEVYERSYPEQTAQLKRNGELQ
ncbi:Gfo/Idh/MocA family oxidoreductase [uncultured Microbacterium sp.]|uniref:Gfo/Idh/MocA family protein n=1 Tax=uncultured Microbacterium sp. TaxID=191216 RepID=UPI00261489D5|nr:Gfo/Idh/MocA family oxidoreductase [uncultured Microbacterium sp.]